MPVHGGVRGRQFQQLSVVVNDVVAVGLVVAALVFVVERDQLVDAVAGCQVVGYIGMFVADRGQHDAHGRGVAGQGVRHGTRVLYARLVPVGDDDDVRTSQVGRVLVAPFPAASAADVARGH